MPSHFINTWLYLGACPVHDRDWSLSLHSAALQKHPPVPAPTAAPEWQAGEEGGGGGAAAASTAAVPGAAEEERTGTLASSTLVLISSVFGSSVLAVPFALAQCGYALGAACLVACALLTLAGAWMLVECARRVAEEEGEGARSRVTLSQIAAKATPRLKDLPEILVVLSCLGSAIAALVVIGGIAPTTFQDISTLAGDARLVDEQPLAEYIRSRGLWILLVFFLVAPLAFLRSLTPLRFAGVFTALAVAYFAASVVASYALPSLDACSVYQTPSPCPLDLAAVATAPPGVIARLLQACPIFFVSFSVNFQVLPLHNALRDPNPATTTAAVAGALAFSTLAYAAAGLGAYFTFGARVRPMLLSNYGNSVLMDAARGLLNLVVGVLYPLVIFAARASIMNLLGPERSSSTYSSRRSSPRSSTTYGTVDDATTTMTTKPPTAAPVFFTITLALFAVTLTAGLLLRDLSTILGVVGAVATLPISLTLPALYLAHFTRKGDTPRERVLCWVAWAGVVLGVAMTGAFLYGTFAATVR